MRGTVRGGAPGLPLLSAVMCNLFSLSMHCSLCAELHQSCYFRSEGYFNPLFSIKKSGYILFRSWSERQGVV